MLEPGLTLAADAAAMKMIALVVFVAFWVAVVVRLLLVGSDRYRQAARLPLEEESVIEPRTNHGNGAAHNG